MKSVLFVIPTLGGGGAEKVLVNLVNHLDRSKYKIEIVTLFKNDTNRQFLSTDIPVHSCFGKQFRGNTVLLKLLSAKQLYKIVVGRKYDIVVSYLEGPGERAVSGCPYPETKLVNWVHVEQKTLTTASHSYRSVKEFRKALDRFDLTLTVSETVKEDYLSFAELNHPIKVVYNTLEVDDIREKGREEPNIVFDEKCLNLISVGRLTEAKGFDRLIKVHASLRSDGFNNCLYILGEGELRKTLESLADSLGLADSVHFLGFHANPYRYVSRADLFVCSSRREGFSTAVSEALLLGVPVVSTRCSGAEELLGKNNEYGIVVDNTEEGIYAGVKAMIADKAMLNRYREAAKMRSTQFCTETTVGAVEEIFDSL